MWRLLLCFTLSGAAGLVFQTAWSEELGLVLGASQVAVAVVLGAYMGGLALGAAAAARWVDRARRPVRVYALLELGVAAAALAVPGLVGLGERGLHLLLGGGPLGAAEGPGLVFGRIAVAFGVLLLPTGAMGATLPLLARFLVTTDESLGRRVGALYTANTLGAAVGAVAGAFVLLPSLGLRRTTWVGIALDVVVCLVALSLDRETVGSRTEPSHRVPVSRPWILPLIAASGAVSFAYEVLWTRLLGHLLGGSIYGFGAMLGTFLLGLALGGTLAGWLARSPGRARALFAAAQVAIGALAFGGFHLLERLAAGLGGPSRLGESLPLAIVVLLPSATAIGATFPLAVRIAASSAAGAGPASGAVLAWNTVGGIVGALAASLLLLPTLGLAGTLTLAAATNLCLAAVTVAGPRPRRPLLGGLAALGAVALGAVVPAPPWSVLRRSRIGSEPGTVLFHAEGRSATVLALDQGDGWRITTNGLPEAKVRPPGSRIGSQTVARWLALLPLAARPEARELLVVGLGGGVVPEEVPATVERIAVVELEPEVVAANEAIASLRRRDPLIDPRLELRIGDARSVLALTGERFDAIVSQPSHPWTAGSAHLFSLEFFELCAARLRPGGVFVQWIGLPFLDEPLLATLVATLGEAFPEVEVYLPFREVALFLASDRPLEVERSVPRAIAAAPDLWHGLGIVGPADLAAARLLGAEGSRRFGSGAPLATDGRNLIQTRSPRISGAGLTVEGAHELVGELEALDPTGQDPLRLLSRLVAHGALRVAESRAEAMPESAVRPAGLGLVALASGRSREAERAFRRALDLDPDQEVARRALLLLYRRELAGGRPVELLESWPPDDPVHAVAAGWRDEAMERWSELAARDPILGAVDRHDVLWSEATRLRVEWRRRAGGADAVAALRLVDLLLGDATAPSIHLLRARTATAARDVPAAVASLWEIELLGRQGYLSPALAGEVLTLASTLGPEAAEVHRRLAQLRSAPRQP